MADTLFAATYVLPAAGWVCALPGATGPVMQAQTISPERLSEILRFWLLWGAVLSVATVVGLVILLRFLRRFRQRMEQSGRHRRKADTSDVWRQHQLPADWEEQLRSDEKDTDDPEQ